MRLKQGGEEERDWLCKSLPRCWKEIAVWVLKCRGNPTSRIMACNGVV